MGLMAGGSWLLCGRLRGQEEHPEPRAKPWGMLGPHAADTHRRLGPTLWLSS